MGQKTQLTFVRYYYFQTEYYWKTARKLKKLVRTDYRPGTQNLALIIDFWPEKY